MNKILIGIPVGLGLVAIVACLAIQHSSQAAMKERAARQRERADELTVVSVENQRLSNLAAQATSCGSLSTDERVELLRLRAEVGRLRGNATKKDQLATANAQLRDKAAQADSKESEVRALPNFWSKDQLAFAGFSTPEMAVRSMLWAMAKGDVNGWQLICTPQAWSDLQEEWMRAGKSESERTNQIASMAHDLTAPSFGFHVVEQKTTETNVAIVTVSFDGEDRMRKFVLQRIDNDWKFHRMIWDDRAGGRR